MKVAICLAHNYRAFDKPFTMSLIKMQRDFHKNKVGELVILYSEGLQLDEMREEVVQKAMTHEPDYVLLLDTDMDFPDDCIQKMVKHLEKTDYDTVCGMYTFRGEPYMPMIFKGWDELTGEIEFIDKIPNKPFEIDCAGLGIIMIRASFIKKCVGRLFKKTEKLGEEMYFFKEHEPKTLCDPSIDCGHWNLEQSNVAKFLKYNNIKSKDGEYEIPINLKLKFSEKLRRKK